MKRCIITLALAAVAAMGVSAQVVYRHLPTDSISMAEEARLPAGIEISRDSLFAENFRDSVPYDTLVTKHTLHKIFRLPVVYTHFQYRDTTSVLQPRAKTVKGAEWLANELDATKYENGIMQRYYFKHPDLVRYNMATLEAPAKEFHAVVNPQDHKIEFREVEIQKEAPTFALDEVKKRHWIHTFTSSLQFSQAFISPNWYQGGNNNLNALLNLNFNVKLNKEYHPNLLFETNVQYKLGLYSAPDDSLRNYSISEDLFQVNSTFGLKAAKRWYYSVNLQFKTQLLNSYNSNTNDLRSAFMSPGDLNVGLGMTYNYATPKKNFTFDASIAPLSYNMRTCFTDRMNHEQFGIKPYNKTVHHFGSSSELKITWQLSYNIKYSSRLFAFTDYKRFYGDWEHTLAFEINRFLTTQIYAHLRYDTETPKCDDRKWHKLQVKEILSIGFAYKFSSAK